MGIFSIIWFTGLYVPIYLVTMVQWFNSKKLKSKDKKVYAKKL